MANSSAEKMDEWFDNLKDLCEFPDTNAAPVPSLDLEPSVKIILWEE